MMDYIAYVDNNGVELKAPCLINFSTHEIIEIYCSEDSSFDIEECFDNGYIVVEGKKNNLIVFYSSEEYEDVFDDEYWYMLGQQ